MALSFPIFGTGGLWKAASGSGTPSDPFVPAVNLAAGGFTPASVTSLVDSYGLLLADKGQSFTLDANNAGTTVTVPLNATQAIPIGPSYAITLTNTSAGAWTIAVTGALTINGANTNRTLAAATSGVYPTCSLWKKSADAWIMVGSGIT
jgi:hypothetical protein